MNQDFADRSSCLNIAAMAFDLGNVLIKVDHLRFCRRLGDLAGARPEEVYAAVFEGGLEPDYDIGRLSSQEFYQGILQHFHIDLPYPRFCVWWNDIFDPMDHMENLVGELYTRYPLYLVSNTNSLHFPYIYQHFPVLRRFTHFVLSFQVGSRKPEPGIYQALIEEIGCPPAHCLFIDDKRPFADAARRHGLVAWQFNSPEDFINDLKTHHIL